MTKSYAITLYVELDAPETLWETAKKALSVGQVEAASIEEFIGTRQEPRIEDCFRAIFDRNPTFPSGYKIDGSIVEDITDHVTPEPVVEILTIVPDPDEPIILVISDPEKSAWENLEAQNPDLAKAMFDLSVEGNFNPDPTDLHFESRIHEDLCERTAEEVQELINEFQAPPPF